MQFKKIHYIRYVAILLVFMCSLIVVLWAHNVESGVTAEDVSAINKIAEETGFHVVHDGMKNAHIEKQIEFVDKLTYVLGSVVVSSTLAIPPRESREPSAWLIKKSAVCYDMSRMLEKIFRYAGFDVRHVSVFTLQANGVVAALQAIVSPRVVSHALIEIKTSQGWLAVDSPTFGAYVTKGRLPIRSADVGKYLRNAEVAQAHDIFKGPSLIVYGLYSRHGGFYPPYDWIPDLSWPQFITNNCCEIDG